MGNILLIWEEVPLKTRFFLIPSGDVANDLEPHLERSHGKFVNSDEDDSLILLCNAVYGETVEEDGRLRQTVEPALSPYEVDAHVPIKSEIRAVYLSGFIL